MVVMYQNKHKLCVEIYGEWLTRDACPVDAAEDDHRRD